MDTKSQGDLARSPSSRHDGAASHPSNNPNQGPRAYSGLTEVDAPRPVQNTSDDSLYRTHVTLEDRAGGPETWRSRRSWDGGRHLHDRQDQRLERLSRRNSLERVLSWRRRSAEGREGNSDANPARTRRHDVGSPAQEEEEEGEEQEEYSVPDNWYNLDEITAPVPVENPDESPLYRHHSLEQQLSRASHRREAVQEPRPPSPVRPSAREDVDLEQAPPREKLKRRRRRQRRVISRLVTEAYTISYLVFFSILGTLARIGLEALTSYPGAPVAYTTVWVNLAGTLVLGFLSESSERFNGRIAKDSDEPERNSLKPEDPTSSDDSTRNEGHNSPSQPFQTEGDAQRTHDVSFGTGAAAGGEGGGVAGAGPVGDLPTQDQDGSSAAVGEPGKEDDNDEDDEEDGEIEAWTRRPSPLYIGLATGFCGSFTTFSSFARDVFLALSNSAGSGGRVAVDAAARGAGGDVMAMLAVAIATVCISLAALKAGAHLAILAGRGVGRRGRSRGSSSDGWYVPRALRDVLDKVALVLGVPLWAGAAVLTALPPDRRTGAETWRGLVLFALVFAPAGCLARFYLSIHLNGLRPGFPLGTFAANILGTMVLGVAWDLQHGRLLAGGRAAPGVVGCQALQGVMDGFCGCLTTVSTWIAELSSLRRRHAYLYGASTLGLAVALLIAIMGPQRWSNAWLEPTCQIVH